jgi:glycosyltransferase involved in cell wall biosynthesis
MTGSPSRNQANNDGAGGDDIDSLHSSMLVVVDVIIPVHNASSTVEEAVRSAMSQTIPPHLMAQLKNNRLSITVCCYDDGSTDESWSILQRLETEFSKSSSDEETNKPITSSLRIQKSEDGVARGAGFARNKAVALHSHESIENENSDLHFLCLLDSDDTMHPHRVAEQASFMLHMTPEERSRTVLGCNFDRDPPDSTWHYSQWANSLDDDRLRLERFREVTILQPTWFLSRNRFLELGGYVEAPKSELDMDKFHDQERKTHKRRLVHPVYDTIESLRLAEDLRFFHDHLGSNGIIRLHRTDNALVTYRHTGTSQSFRTSRKLLLQLRVLALERSVLRSEPWSQQDDGHFVIWGAGRDGKDVFKALSEDMQRRVYCMVDVDEKKLSVGRYANRDLAADVPILHFSFLATDDEKRRTLQTDWEAGTDGNELLLGRINKGRPDSNTEQAEDQAAKKQKLTKRAPLKLHGLDLNKLKRLPVVVCVAMYRTSGALERNVHAIGRKEGSNLWHFS